MNLTKIENGKRVVISDNLSDGSIDKILGVFKECKMEESKLINLDKYMFSLLAKSGRDTISVLIDKEEHKYPDFMVAINKNHIKKWEYQHEFPSEPLWVRTHKPSTGPQLGLGLEEVLNEIIGEVRTEWTTN